MVGAHFPVFFAKPAPLSLRSSHRGRRQTDSAVKCDTLPSKQVPSTVTRLAVSLSLPSISSFLYFGQCHPHTRRLPHRSTENLYDITKAQPLLTPPGTKRKSSHLQKEPGKGGKTLPNGPYSRSKTVFYVSGVLVKQTSTRKHLFFWVLSPQKSQLIR